MKNAICWSFRMNSTNKLWMARKCLFKNFTKPWSKATKQVVSWDRVRQFKTITKHLQRKQSMNRTLIEREKMKIIYPSLKLWLQQDSRLLSDSKWSLWVITRILSFLLRMKAKRKTSVNKTIIFRPFLMFQRRWADQMLLKCFRLEQLAPKQWIQMYLQHQRLRSLWKMKEGQERW